MLILGLLVTVVLIGLSFLSPSAGVTCYVAWKLVRPQEYIIGFGGTLPLERIFAIGLMLSTLFHFKLFRPRPFVWDRLNWALLVFLGVNYLTVLDTLSIGQTVWTSNNFATTVILYLLLVNLIENREHLRRLLWVYVACATWLAATSLQLTEPSGGLSAGEIQRSSGLPVTFGNPNDFATQLALTIPYMFALFAAERKVWLRLLLLGSIATSLVAMTLTGSRGGMLQLVAVLLLFGLHSRRKFVIVPAMILLFSVTWWTIPEPYKERYRTIVPILQNPEDADASAEARMVGWHVAWLMFTDRPVFGVGAGNFPRAFERHYSYKGLHGWTEPHNFPGQLLATLGLAGAIAFGAYAFCFFRESVALSGLLKKTPRRSALLYWVNISNRIVFYTLFVAGLTDHNLYKLNWYFAGALLVITAGATRKMIAEDMSTAGQSQNIQNEFRD